MFTHIARAAILLVAVSPGLAQVTSQVSQLPAGTLSGDRYENPALGFGFKLPPEWNAKVAPEVRIGDEHDKVVNRCTKVLLELESPRKVEGRFNSVAMLFVVDPACFSSPPFPTSLDKDGLKRLNKVVDKMLKPFSHTPFISQYGARVAGMRVEDHVFIQLTGGLIINAITGRKPEKKEPLEVTTFLFFTESKGYWVALGYLADDAGVNELAKARFSFKEGGTSGSQ